MPTENRKPDIRSIVTDSLVGMIAAVTRTTPLANEPLPSFIQAPVDRAVDRIRSYLLPGVTLQVARANRVYIAGPVFWAAQKELRALLDAPASEAGKSDIASALESSDWAGTSIGNKVLVAAAITELRKAAQPQGEPVAKSKPVAKLHAERLTGKDGEYGITVEDSQWFNTCRLTGGEFYLYAEQHAPVTVVPDGYCIMPRQLTAENGAKALLLGEFKLLVTKECPECCELEEPTERCSICDGEGEYGQKHTIPWDQLKYIYSKAVSGLAVKTESAKSR